VEITVTGRHPGVSQEIRAYAEDKVGRLTRIFDRLSSARVILEVNGGGHCAEASVHGPRGAVFVARGAASDPMAAIDELLEHLERQIRKFKARMEGHRLLRA
jgi:putative sigma-54 modulation protein